MNMHEEVAGLLALQPSVEELDEMREGLEIVSSAIVHANGAWSIDERFSHLVGGEDLGVVKGRLERGLSVLAAVEAAMHMMSPGG